jgi:hypothetical protein
MPTKNPTSRLTNTEVPPAYGGQSLLADEPSDDDGVGDIVHLLEERPEQNGEEKEKQSFGNGPFRNGGGPDRLPFEAHHGQSII